jgi:hypothetical protein
MLLLLSSSCAQLGFLLEALDVLRFVDEQIQTGSTGDH